MDFKRDEAHLRMSLNSFWYPVKSFNSLFDLESYVHCRDSILSWNSRNA